MSLNAKLDEQERQRQWAERAEYGRGGSHAKDRWVCYTLMRGGEIDSGQYGAAVKLSGLLERAKGFSGGHAERVDGGGADPHARMADAVHAGLAAECALQAVVLRRTGRTRENTRRKAMAILFDFPHPTMREYRAEMGNLAWRDATRIARDCLWFLELYFDDCERDRRRQANLVGHVLDKSPQTEGVNL